jgi:hypothetical protein
MIDGLKLAMTGEEVLLSLNERIERYRSRIQFKQDEIDGKVDPPPGPHWEVPAETVEEEILQHRHGMHILMMIRDHILQGETYLISRRDMEFAELFPDPPGPAAELDPTKGIRWVARSVYADEDRRATPSPVD